MPRCAAPNCTSKNASYRFPSDPERRRKWTINCRRDKWTAKPSDRLCIKHFETSQFYTKRINGRLPLKGDATPTLFDVPNPPMKLGSTRRSLERTVSHMLADAPQDSSILQCQNCRDNKKEIARLRGQCLEKDEEIARLKSQHIGQCLEKDEEIARLKSQLKGSERNAPKLICLSQYAASCRSEDCEEDDSVNLTRFLGSAVESIDEGAQEETNDQFDNLKILAAACLDDGEANAHYYIVGWVIFKEIDLTQCAECSDKFTNKDLIGSVPISQAGLTIIRSYTKDGNLSIPTQGQYLKHPSPPLLHLFRIIEAIFRLNIDSSRASSSPEEYILEKVGSNPITFPECHADTAFRRMVRRYICLRLHAHSKNESATCSTARREFGHSSK